MAAKLTVESAAAVAESREAPTDWRWAEAEALHEPTMLSPPVWVTVALTEKLSRFSSGGGAGLAGFADREALAFALFFGPAMDTLELALADEPALVLATPEQVAVQRACTVPNPVSVTVSSTGCSFSLPGSGTHARVRVPAEEAGAVALLLGVGLAWGSRLTVL